MKTGHPPGVPRAIHVASPIGLQAMHSSFALSVFPVALSVLPPGQPLAQGHALVLRCLLDVQRCGRFWSLRRVEPLVSAGNPTVIHRQ